MVRAAVALLATWTWKWCWSTPWIIRICKPKLQRYPLIRRIFIPQRRLFLRFFHHLEPLCLDSWITIPDPQAIWKKISKGRSFSSKMFSYMSLSFGLPFVFNRCNICSFIDKGKPADIRFYMDCPIKGKTAKFWLLAGGLSELRLPLKECKTLDSYI